jgi:hypothetical protein
MENEPFLYGCYSTLLEYGRSFGGSGMLGEDLSADAPGRLVTTDLGALANGLDPMTVTLPVDTDLVVRLAEASAAAGALAGVTRAGSAESIRAHPAVPTGLFGPCSW